VNNSTGNLEDGEFYPVGWHEVIKGEQLARRERERESRVEAGLNTSTVALPGQGSNEKEVSNLGQ
jgi:hypothetical protein